jgi:hypothetical protein
MQLSFSAIDMSCHKTHRCSALASTTGRCEISRPKLKGAIMKIVVIGGTGLIGSKLVSKLRAHGYEAIPASPNSAVNTITGEGLTFTWRDWVEE